MNPSPAPAAANPEEIDASSRLPLFVLFTGAAAWAALASLFQLIASIKFHSPDFLAGCPGMTYGRVHAAAIDSLLYGFALPAGWGVALYIFSQLGRARVAHPWILAAGGKLWHLGVLAGIVGILAGDSSGFDYFEMPRYAAFLLFLGFLMIGTCSLLTLQRRHSIELSFPQGFLMSALLWFPWIFSTAAILLLVSPVRGVQQSVVDWWYSANLAVVCLGLIGLAATFYFLKTGPATPSLHPSPVEADAPAFELDYRPVFLFWTLILFGSWVGIPASAPVPAWMPTLSTIATALLIVPLLTVAVMCFCGSAPAADTPEPTARVAPAFSGPGAHSPTSRFFKFAAVAWLAAGAMRILDALPWTSPFTHFTWFTVAQSQLHNYGFFAMAMFGAIYTIVPRVTGIEWPLPRAVRAHLWCACLGVLLSTIPLAVGGLAQGVQLNHPRVPFMDLTRATLPFLRVSTLGDTLVLLGNVLLLLNLAGLSIAFLRTHFVPAYHSFAETPAPAEAQP